MKAALAPGAELREPAPAPPGPWDDRASWSWLAGELRGAVERWLGVAYLEVLRVERPDPHSRDAGVPAHLAATLVGVDPQPDGSRLARCDLTVSGADGATLATGAAHGRWPAASLSALPMDRLRAAVRLGEVAGTFRYRVDRGDVERLRDALGTDAASDAVPTIAFGALDPVERRDLDLDGFLLELPLTRTGGGNAFNEVTYERPLRTGEELTVTTRYTEVYEKPGSRGTLLFRVRENEVRDDEDRLVATSRCGHVLGFRMPEHEVVP